MSALSSAEILALARQVDRAALAIDLHSPTLCPVGLLRMLEEDLVLRAALQSVEEMTGRRAVASCVRHRPSGPHWWRRLLQGWAA